MNLIFLLGNVTRNPEEKQVKKGDKTITVTKFDLAVNRPYSKSGEQVADFFHCVSFGKQAEFVTKYFKKGSRMVVVGRAQNNNYTNKNNEKVYGYQIVTEKVFFGEQAKKTNQTEELEPEMDFENMEDAFEGGLPFNS